MTNISSGQQAKSFKTFPEFSKMTYADKHAYEKLITQYPPVSDIMFPTLMLWWNQLGSLAIAQLNGNLVISYWLPGDEKRSGLSIIGTEDLDESICTIFDHLKEKGENPRLVNVPEFVIGHLKHPELFNFESERSFDEYVVPIAKYYPLNHIISYRRLRVRKFISAVGEENIQVRSLDLSNRVNQRMLLDRIAKWPQKGTLNELTDLSCEALDIAITDSEALGMENICIFINDELHAYLLYHLPSDKRYAIFSHAKFSYEYPHLFDYSLYAFARWFAERGISYVNLDLDYNVPMLRMIKLALGPENFFRKYSVEPAVTIYE